MTPKAQVTKNRYIGLHQNKKFLCITGHNQQRRQHMKWEKLFTSHISDKGLISKIHKELL